jgi:soluble lytic murein transglycosylase
MIGRFSSSGLGIFVGLALAGLATPADARSPSTQTFAVPPVLTASDADLLRRGYVAAHLGKTLEAGAAMTAITDPLLNGSLTAEILLAPSNTLRTQAALHQWLAANADHAQATRVYQLAAQTNPAAPKPQEAGNRWGQWLARKPPRPATAAERNAAKLAWNYYSVGQLGNAMARANTITDSPTPESGFALWVAGLAAWRQNDCDAAAGYFTKAAAKPAMSDDLIAASSFWAARSQQQCGKFDAASGLLHQAAATGDTFYGLLASRTLGLAPSFSWGEQEFSAADWKKISASAAVRRAAALVQIGETALADEELRAWWGRAPESQWASLIRFADAEQLWGAKLALARRPPPGERAGKSAYYPLPQWWPDGGGAVPRALVLAFMRQESAFRIDTVSRANARGLMQFLPATARDVAQDPTITETDPRLNDPLFAVRIGKTYLRQLANSSITNGHLLKVAASYNAGPGNVRNWNGTIPGSDPLLYLESIPLTETRDYVETVVKNFWMYQLRLGEPTATLDAMARGEWPAFPGANARSVVSIADGVHPGEEYANR